jgi:hypothetical protein
MYELLSEKWDIEHFRDVIDHNERKLLSIKHISTYSKYTFDDVQVRVNSDVLMYDIDGFMLVDDKVEAVSLSDEFTSIGNTNTEEDCTTDISYMCKFRGDHFYLRVTPHCEFINLLKKLPMKLIPITPTITLITYIIYARNRTYIAMSKRVPISMWAIL